MGEIRGSDIARSKGESAKTCETGPLLTASEKEATV